MIVVNLMGGMGNQMFQYALGRQLSIKHNKKLVLDKSFLLRRDIGGSFVYRDFDLDIFDIKGEVVDSFHRTGDFQVLEEPFHAPDLRDTINRLDYGKNIYISGFFQKEYYFTDIKNEILEDFKLTIKEDYIKKLETEILSSNSVCVNIRRGDYVKNDFHGFHGQDFVSRAVSEISKVVENPFFYIFSDEIDWCQENIKIEHPHFYVDHSFKGDRFSSYLKLMSSCKHFIIPNSTFAWWSAWLNQNDNKKVFVPKNWFQSANINTDGLIPNQWNRI